MNAERFCLIFGSLAVLAGLAYKFRPQLYFWWGQLPGDVSVDTGTGHIFLPLTSGLLVGTVFLIVYQIFRK